MEKKLKSWQGWLLFGGTMVVVFVLGLLVSALMDRQAEIVSVFNNKKVEIKGIEARNEIFGENYPREYNTWTETIKTDFKSEFNGNEAVDVLEQRPEMVILWAGYAFSKDYSTPRGHMHAIDDMRHTLRVGSPMTAEEGPQPATCWTCKSPDVPRMMEAYRQLSAVTDYPLHVGVTEAGTYQMGLLKSGMGIGGMLLEGIGDTIRVSLAAEPEKEVEAGYNILRAVGFPVAGPEVITCPTCGRTQYPCTEIANEVEKRLQGYKKSIKVAVMGCVVNGPGEAREADIGIAGGKGEAVLFLHGKPVKKLTGDNILDQFMDEIYKL